MDKGKHWGEVRSVYQKNQKQKRKKNQKKKPSGDSIYTTEGESNA